MDMDGSTITGLSGVVLAGIAAGKVLWAKIDAQSAKLQAESDKQLDLVRKDLVECRDEHKRADEKIEAVNMKLLLMTSTVGKLEGRIEGFNEAQRVMGKQQTEMQDQLDHKEDK